MSLWSCFMRRQLLGQFFAVFSFVSLVGCLPEQLDEPIPVTDKPVLPGLLCKPFIQTGYTGRMSYYPGESMQVFFDSKEVHEVCRLTIYTVSGDSAYSTSSSLPAVPQIPADASENGFDFPVAVEFEVPNLKSGIYLIEKQIPFIIKTNDPVDVMLVYPSNTANAYATSGGKSLYTKERPASVSFERPIQLQALSEACLKWFDQLQGFSIGYVADIDLDDFSSFSHAKVLVVAGHSEYWTRQARHNFDRFVDFGGDALVLSGNTMWWQVRYSEGKDRMICYKDGDLDPVIDPLFKTINWNEPLVDYPIWSSIGAHFPLGGYGLKTDAGWDGLKIASPSSPLFEGLGLKRGDIISLPSLEYDGAPVNGYDAEGYPLIDNSILNFEKIELLAFDKGYRASETNATFIVFRKTPTSGIVINTATTNWCSSTGMGGASGDVIKRITLNALAKLVNDAPVFIP
ncbi:MAG TPA: N,N-dimethylformamidase beta subunit family domain-containing protein [Chryseosolibacter sp.]|nr:N,N-dimethylformamidase beta subunit family domain-containing protein [Chryseosolibacter sp.]